MSSTKIGDSPVRQSFRPDFDFPRLDSTAGDSTVPAKAGRVTIDQLRKATGEAGMSDNLKLVLQTSVKLKELKATEIRFSESVLTQSGNPVLFPHTINVIQGQAGVHKSRLAETICSAFLKLPRCKNELLGFDYTTHSPAYVVVYVDTERNLTEQLPYALQSIQLKAGYDKTDHPDNFKYISLLQISRKERFASLREYLEHVRQSSPQPLLVVLDVSTDCIEDFNKPEKSMELIDLMNVVINEHDVVFLCLIHENPKSDKARGHFGTELMNKASTVMQVGFEKDVHQNDTDLIRVKYLKCRGSARHTSFYAKYSAEARDLVLADESEIATLANSRKKVSLTAVAEILGAVLEDGGEIARQPLLDKLCEQLNVGKRIIEERLSEIVSSGMELTNKKGGLRRIAKEKRGKTVFYMLTENG